MKFLILIALLGGGYVFYNQQIAAQPSLSNTDTSSQVDKTTQATGIPRVKWWKSYVVSNGSSMTNTQRSQHMDRFIQVYEQKMIKLKHVVAKNYITNHDQFTDLMNGINFHFQSSMDVQKALKFTCKTDRKQVKRQLDRVQSINQSVLSAIRGDGIKMETHQQ